MAGRFSVEAVFKAVDKITAPISRMQNRIGKFARASGRSIDRVNRSLKTMNRGLNRLGVHGAIATAAVGVGFLDIIKTGAEFDQMMIRAQAKTRDFTKGGSKDMKKLREEVKRLGGTTEFTGIQVAAGADRLTMAGFSAKEAIGSLVPVIDLATIADIELGEASRIATKLIGAFGLKSATTAEKTKALSSIVDMLAANITTATTEVDQLFLAFRDGASGMRLAGQDMETIAIMSALLADATIDATKAGTGLKRIGIEFSQGGDIAQAVDEMLNFAGAEPLFDEAEGKFRNMIDIFRDLRKGFDMLPEKERGKNMSKLFGKITTPSAAALLFFTGPENSEKLAKITKNIKESQGIGKKMADFIRDSVSGALKALASAIESVKLNTFDLVKGPLRDIIDRMVDWIRVNRDFIAQNMAGVMETLIDKSDDFAGTLKVIGKSLLFVAENFDTVIKVGTGLIGLKIALAAIIPILTVVNLLIAANPITIWITAIALVIAGIAALITWLGKWDAAGTALTDSWEFVKGFFEKTWESIVSSFEFAMSTIEKGFDGMITKAKEAAALARDLASKATFGFIDTAAQAKQTARNERIFKLENQGFEDNIRLNKERLRTGNLNLVIDPKTRKIIEFKQPALDVPRLDAPATLEQPAPSATSLEQNREEQRAQSGSDSRITITTSERVEAEVQGKLPLGVSLIATGD